MVSQMNLVQNAARLAMADNRAAMSRVTARRRPASAHSRLLFAGCAILVVVLLAAFVSAAV